MKHTILLRAGIVALLCLAILVPVVSAAGSTTFNRSAATPGSSFYSGLTVLMEPEGTTFSKDVVVTFTLTPAQWQQALDVTNGNTANIAIASFDRPTKTWKRENPVTLSTTVDGKHVVSTTTRHSGLFGVFYTVEGATPTPTPQTFGNMATGTPAPAQSPAAAVSPVKTAAGKPQSAPTQSPGLPGIVVVGVIGAVALLVARKTI